MRASVIDIPFAIGVAVMTVTKPVLVGLVVQAAANVSIAIVAVSVVAVLVVVIVQKAVLAILL